jgi:DNA-binding NtrC family response regulator
MGRTEALERTAPGVVGCRVAVVDGPDTGRAIDLRAGAIVIGSAAGCELTLSDAAVSARHVRIEVVEGGVAVADLGSSNGTHHLGGRIERAVLPIGATLGIGRSRVSIGSLEEPGGRYSSRVSYAGLVGSSPAMRHLYAVLEQIEAFDYTVVIHGETGTGKELVARAIHLGGSRSGGPFEVCDATSLQAGLAESQLFGHERGAFTGSSDVHRGVFERASGGTLFIDEIGELALDLQPKLLRVLERREVRRLGGEVMIPVDVRVIAATHRDLGAEVRAGRFREDLYFRLNLVSIDVPPLRARREDIPILVRHFLAELGAGDVEPSAAIMERMTTGYDWPGNVRELRNAVARVRALGSLPREVGETPAVTVDTSVAFKDAKLAIVDAFERDYLAAQLRAAGDNISEAARRAGMERNHLKRLLRKHGLI